MSSFFRSCFHPYENVVRSALWMDEYFGRNRHGVQFDPNGPIFTTYQVEIPEDLVFAPVKVAGDSQTEDRR